MSNSAIWFVAIYYVVATFNPSSCRPSDSTQLTIVSREEWGALPATGTSLLNTPTPLVVIHHSSVPGACFTREECSAAMRSMQHMHQVGNHWADIGYNFAVGSDGLVYEGRGWNRIGAHAQGVNSQSIGIVLIGHWVSELPPQIQLDVTQRLILEGISRGYISPQYSLLGHRHVGATECPGQVLYDEISTWGHYNPAAAVLTE